MRYHKYLPVAFVYFFINVPAFFPEGLMVTSIFAPLFYLWLLVKRRRFVLEPFLAVLFIFACANVYDGIIWKDFVISSLLLLALYVVCFAFAVAISESKCLESLFRTIIQINFWFAALGLIVRFTPAYKLMWLRQTGEVPGQVLIRFRMFTYEPSYYALLITPLILYTVWLMIRRPNRANAWLLFQTIVPLLMSASFGGFLALGSAVVGASFYLNRGAAKYKWPMIAVLVAVSTYALLPSTSAMKQRVDNVLSGQDNSTTVRTTGAFAASYAMAKSKDIWFGIGLGETKDYGIEFMAWDPTVGRIASSVAETLGELGVLGLVLRFSLIAYFFIKTRPDHDPFRLSLFIAMFVLQFASGNKNNLPEYVMWILAFSPSVGFFSKHDLPVSSHQTFPAVAQTA